MKKEKLYEILMYVCIFVFGLALTIWADKVTNLVSIILGCLSLIYSAFGFISFFRNKERKLNDNIVLVYAITMLVIGGILIFKANFLKELLSFIIGFYIFITSSIRLYESIKIGNSQQVKLTGSIILSLVGIFIGIMCIVGKYIIPDLIVTYIGILLIIYSVISIINIIILRRIK